MKDSKLGTFTDDTRQENVEKKDILQNGDWILKWNAKSNTKGETGFALFTPYDFDPKSGQGPLGGLLLAAFFYLIENESGDFHREIVQRASRLHQSLEAEAKQEGGHTLN